MGTTMKALVKAKAEPGIWMHDVPIPEIGPDDVLIKVHKTAICGTDIHIYSWDEWAQKTIPVPMVVGHEFGGEIAEMGANVRGLKIGQRVSGEGHIVGETTRNARAGRLHLSPDTVGVGVNRPGAFAEYLALPARNVVELPDGLPMEVAAILDPLGNATHAALSFDLVGEDVLVTGAGPIGIMAAVIARHAGARHVVITDINDVRLELARKMGTAATVNVAREDLRERMRALGMKEGFDVGLEMSGNPAAFEQMIDTMIMGGKIAMLGLPSRPITTDWSKIVLKGLTIKGIYGREMFDTWYKMLAMLDSGLDIQPIITHRLPASRYQEGFETMASGRSGKVVLDWAG
jgi:threonine 3-dehydrogenase